MHSPGFPRIPIILVLTVILTGPPPFILAAESSSPSPSCAPLSQTIPVPGPWVPPALTALPTSDSLSARPGAFAWFRAWIKPHDSFFTPHERNLFAESVHLNIQNLAQAHEVYVNGSRVGAGGKMPPSFEPDSALRHRHKIPPGLLRKGEWNCIAIRVYTTSPTAGFLGEAPFIMDYFNECVLEGKWEFANGDDPGWACGPTTIQPTVGGFHQFHDSHRVLGEAAETTPGPRLSPEASWRAFQPQTDFRVDLLISEPEVAQPTHLSFDSRGRLWVAQYRQYPYPAGLKMLSRDRYYRAQYDKVPAPPPHHDRGRDRITIHQDTNGDGIPDVHKIFVDGLNMANAVLPADNGVWVMNTPYLLFFPDENHDDIPDGPPSVHLAGFGLEDTHSVANGLVWGPDGWIYGGQGSTTSSRVTRPGMDPPQSPGVYFEGCMVWRYHPPTRTYEIFAEGSGNTFGLELDGEGRLFSGHNGGETRGWHYVQNGFYLKQGVDPAKFGPPRNPYSFGQLPPLRPQQSIQRFTHLFAVGEGTALPARSQGSLFAIDPLHNLVIEGKRHALGSTFETSDVGPALSTADTGFRPVFIVNAPDGSLYIADFYEHYIAHGQHYQSQIDPTTGRIYRLRGAQSSLESDVQLDTRSSLDLLRYLSHPNKWHRLMAVRILSTRREAGTRAPLVRLLQDSQAPSHAALGALWVLHQTGWLAPELDLLRSSLQHPDPAVRLWTCRFIGDEWGQSPGLGVTSVTPRPLPASLIPQLLERAAHETHAEVRSQLASTARRLAPELALKLVIQLASHDEDKEDPYIPHLCWWVFESLLPAQSSKILEWAHDRDLWRHPILVDHVFPRIVQRLAMEARPQDLKACAEWIRSAPGKDEARRLISALEEAFRGRLLPALPPELVEALAQSKGDTLTLELRQGHAVAVQRALNLITTPQTPREERLLLLRILGELRPDSAYEPLWNWMQQKDSIELHRTALHALSGFAQASQNWSDRTLKQFGQWPRELQPTVLEICLSRTGWTRSLIDHLTSQAIATSSVPMEVRDRLVRHKDEAIRRSALALFPEAQIAQQKLQENLDTLERRILEKPGNPYAGESLFMERCSGCHRLFHKGRDVGPNLTNYQRDHLGTLLMSIVNPNAEIREGFMAYQLEARDGRSWTGLLLHHDAHGVGLRTTDGETVTLSQPEILSLEPAGRSLMPEGLLNGLDDPALRDFFAFLRSSQPFSR